jgi:hypothetical protein
MPHSVWAFCPHRNLKRVLINVNLIVFLINFVSQRQKTIFRCPTNHRIRRHLSKISPSITKYVEGQRGIQNIGTREGGVQRKLSDGGKSVIRHLSEWSESSDSGQTVAHTVGKVTGGHSVWKLGTVCTMSNNSIWIINKCKVFLIGAKSSVISYDDIDSSFRNTLLKPRDKNFHASTTELIRAPDFSLFNLQHKFLLFLAHCQQEFISNRIHKLYKNIVCIS